MASEVERARPESMRRLALVLAILVCVVGLWSLTARPTGGLSILGYYTRLTFGFNLAISYVLALCGYVMWSPRARGARVARCALLSGSLLLVLGLVELPAMLGLLDYRVVLTPRIVGGAGPHNRLYEEHGGYFHRPAHDAFVSNLPGDAALIYGIETGRRYESRHRYDANGFRNDRDVDRAAVVMLGDSFLEGYKVTQEAVVSARLANASGVEVVNLGQADFGPEHELAVLRALGLGLEPSVVVWMFFEGNDVYDLARSVTDWRRRIREDRTFARRSFTRNLFTAIAIYSRRWDDETDIPMARLAAKGAHEGERIYFEISPKAERNPSHLDQLHAALREARSLAREHGSAFLLVFVPLKFRVYEDLLEIHDESPLAAWRTGDLPTRFARWAESEGIEYLDLTQPLREASANGQLTYFLDDAHWTGAGHEVAALAIGRRLQARRWLSTPDEVR